MGLITQEAMIVLNGGNINYFKELNYEIPTYIDKQNRISVKKGTSINVKTQDLTKGSNVMVDVECDRCAKILAIRWCRYISHKHDNKYYCQKCASGLHGKDNLKKSILKKSTTFEQWCRKNNKEDLLDRWCYELNKCSPNEVTFRTNAKYYFNCPRDIHSPELKNISVVTRSNGDVIVCNKCNSFAQWGIDNIGGNFLEKYWDYNKNTINPWEVSYGSGKKVFIKCQEKNYHDSYDIRCSEFSVKNGRCPYCCNHKGKVHPLDSLGILLENKGLINLWSDKNEKSPYEYAPKSNKQAYWKCEIGKHNDYKRTILSSNGYDFRCAKCSGERNESFIQEKVRKYLIKLGYAVLHELDCNLVVVNPKTKCKLRYDNEVVGLNLIIEVHGEQHYAHNNSITIQSAKKSNITPKQQLEYQKWKDEYKKNYALSQNYHYLEIPYYTDDKEKTWKKLIDYTVDEIKKINNKTKTRRVFNPSFLMPENI